MTDRDTGALLLRDAGSPVDTHWIDDRADLPRIVRAGRHIARTKRYIRNYGAEVEPADLVAEVETQAGRGDGWVKLVGDWIDRDAGDLTPCWPAEVAAAAIARAHELGARVTAHCFGEQSVADLVAAGIDCIEHGTGLTDDVVAEMARAGNRSGARPGCRSTTSRRTPTQAGAKFPALRRPHARPARPGRQRPAGRLRGRRADLRRHRRRRRAPARPDRPARWRPCTTRWGYRRTTPSVPPRGGPATGSASRAWWPARRPTSCCTTRTRWPTCASWPHPARVVLRGRVVA